MKTGRIVDIHRSSKVDGPGIRSAVIFKGCSPACPWCDTPESHTTDAEIWFLPGRCVGCDACLEVCPQVQMATGDGSPSLGSAFCTQCGQCVEVCDQEARVLIGREITLEELISEIERDRALYDESGGGVTFSGGEPLLQPEFLLECLETCRERQIHTAVHTHGFGPTDILLEVARKTDLLLFELKLADNDRHRQLTGVPVYPILENLTALTEAGAEVSIRFPLLPGINDDAQNVDAIAELVKEMKGISRAHILPYARYDRSQFEDMLHPEPINPVESPALETIREAERSLESRGLMVLVG